MESVGTRLRHGHDSDPLTFQEATGDLEEVRTVVDN
jgi:hypothetical protein